MKTLYLKPILESKGLYEPLEKEIIRVLRKNIYAPILADTLNTTVKNAEESALVDAIRSGRIQFNRGRFSGRFNAEVSKELKRLGAQWDRKQGTWNIPQSSLPIPVRSAISASHARFEETLKKIDKQLAEIIPAEIAGQVKSAPLFDASLWKVDREFEASVKHITVAPKLTKDQSERISKEYEENLERYIADFTQAQVENLRKTVRESVLAGNRYETLVEGIQKSYGVSQSKAKFLARQETALMTTKFKEVRYQQAGVNEYEWRCVAGSPKHPVRPSHKALEGKVFRWDQPPVTTMPGEPQVRNNPGEDFNCRCFAKPIVRFK